MRGGIFLFLFFILIVAAGIGAYFFLNAGNDTSTEDQSRVDIVDEAEETPDTEIPEEEDTTDQETDESSDGSTSDDNSIDSDAETPTQQTDPNLDTSLNDSLNNDLFDLLAAREDLSSFTEAIAAADLKEFVESDINVITIIVPTNSAFAEIDSTYQDLLTPDRFNDLIEFVNGHIIRGRIDANTIVNRTTLPTLTGDGIIVSTSDGKIFLDNNEVLEIDIEGRNGYIFIIDGVILREGVR